MPKSSFNLETTELVIFLGAPVYLLELLQIQFKFIYHFSLFLSNYYKTGNLEYPKLITWNHIYEFFPSTYKKYQTYNTYRALKIRCFFRAVLNTVSRKKKTVNQRRNCKKRSSYRAIIGYMHKISSIQIFFAKVLIIVPYF